MDSKLRDKLNRRLQQVSPTHPAPPEALKTEDTHTVPIVVPSTKSSLIDDLRARMVRIQQKHEKGPENTPENTLEGSETVLKNTLEGSEACPEYTSKNTLEGLFLRNLGGEEVETEFGPVLVITRTFSKNYHHGNYLAADFLQTGPGLNVLAPHAGTSPAVPAGAVFLDTETTGLARGTGTLPFLIGVGFFNEDGCFVVKQVISREPAEEQAQLSVLSGLLKNAAYLVTFNGKAFDVPLINTRYVMQHQQNPAAKTPHLDLLMAARKVFKRRLSRCNLTHLESAVLGFERVDDIPGSEIPGVYLKYLRGEAFDAMEKVIDHNALDLVGLAALGAALEEMYLDPSKVAHAADHLGLAKAAFRAGEEKRADDHLERATHMGMEIDAIDAHGMAASAASRRKDYASSIHHLKKIIDEQPDNAFAHLQLSKHLEHREKNYDAALVHARFTSEAEGEEASLHRVARIEAKLKRTVQEKIMSSVDDHDDKS